MNLRWGNVLVLIALVWYVAWRAATSVGPWWLTAISCSVGILAGFGIAAIIDRRRDRRQR